MITSVLADFAQAAGSPASPGRGLNEYYDFSLSLSIYIYIYRERGREREREREKDITIIISIIGLLKPRGALLRQEEG